MCFILEILCALVVSMTSILWYFRNYKLRKFYEQFPSPPGVPILGNTLDFKSAKVMLPTFSKYANTYGGLVKIRIGPVKRVLLVTDYKFMEFILSGTQIIKKTNTYKSLLPWLGTGLLTSDGMKWKKHRRMITPAFHFQILDEFIDIFEIHCKIFVEKLEKHVDNASLNIYPLVTLCTLDIICDTAMGTYVNAQGHEDSDYVKAVKEMCRTLAERALSPIGFSDFLYSFTSNYRVQRRVLKVLHGHTDNVIAHKLKEVKKRPKRISESEDGIGIKKKRAFLDLLLQAKVNGRPLTRTEIREEVDTFMFEGHDTTASAISFALYCLANDREVQKKAVEEQLEIFGDQKSPHITHQALNNMKYLENVIKETLRLYPSVPLFGRQTDKDIEYNGLTIPKGVQFTIYSYGVHRNAKYFPEPEEFNPERFQSIDGRHPYIFIPFSAGPRNCIGQKFAMLEMKCFLSKVIRNFELIPASPCHKLELTAETVLKSANGINIGIKQRH